MNKKPEEDGGGRGYGGRCVDMPEFWGPVEQIVIGVVFVIITACAGILFYGGVAWAIAKGAQLALGWP